MKTKSKVQNHKKHKKTLATECLNILLAYVIVAVIWNFVLLYFLSENFLL